MRVHRLIAILMMIDRKKHIKAGELARSLEVSSRTIYRDIDVLCEAGFPIYATTGPKGGITFAEGYSLGMAEGAENISIATLLKQVPSVPDSATTAKAIESAFDQLKKISSDSRPSMQDRILIDSDSWWGESEDPFEIRQLIDMLWSLTTIEISYAKSDGMSSVRQVNPYGLILKYTVWYMVGYCHQAEEVRTFRCDRITGISPTERHYQIPLTFDLKEHWEHSVQRFRTSKTVANDYLVRLEIPALYAEHFEQMDINWHAREEGNYTATVNMESFTLAKQEVMKMIGYVKVQGPQELVEYAKGILERQMERYE